MESNSLITHPLGEVTWCMWGDGIGKFTVWTEKTEERYGSIKQRVKL